MDLGYKIRSLRKQAGWNLEEFSRRSGVALSTLSRIETGKFRGHLGTHEKICRAFGISLPDLYREVDSPENGAVSAAPPAEEVETFTYNEKAQSILLVKQVMQKTMLPELLVLHPAGKTHVEQKRLGTERLLLVLEGEVAVQVDTQRYPLRKHGTLYFKASLPHQVRNAGKGTAKVLSVLSPVAL